MKNKNKVILVITAIAILLALILISWKIIIPNKNYENAITLLDAQKYDEAISCFKELNGYKASEQYITYITALTYKNNNQIVDAALEFGKLQDFLDSNHKSLELWKSFSNKKIISSEYSYSVAILENGTVVTTPSSVYDNSPDLSSWQNIVSVAVCDTQAIGLMENGRCVASDYRGNKNTENGICDVDYWENIVEIETSQFVTVGLKSDGTVITSSSYYGNIDTSDWKDIIHISLYDACLVGLKKDGTVVSTGSKSISTNMFKDIVNIATSDGVLYALKSDGTIMCSDSNYVNNWVNVSYITANGSMLAGIDVDGNILGLDKEWSDLNYIFVGDDHCISVTNNGVLQTSGDNSHNQCEIESWNNVRHNNKKYNDFELKEKPSKLVSKFESNSSSNSSTSNNDSYSVTKGANGTYTYRCTKTCNSSCLLCENACLTGRASQYSDCTFSYSADSKIGWIGCPLCGTVDNDYWHNWYSNSLKESNRG